MRRHTHQKARREDQMRALPHKMSCRLFWSFSRHSASGCKTTMIASQQRVMTIMTNEFREGMRTLLLKSYLHISTNECACAMCGRRGVPLAFHVIERSFDKEARDIPYEQGFVQFSFSAGYIRGAFPVCTTCSPPCRKCKLPTNPPSVNRFANSVQGKIGLGICIEHIHWFVVVGVVKYLWRRWVSPTQGLVDQAVRMGWIPAGVEPGQNSRTQGSLAMA